MKPIIFPLILSIGLAACQSSPTLIKRKLTVVVPPDSMYVCPIETKYPDWKTLNDVDVAKTVLKLHKNNVACKNSLDAIRKFLLDSKAKLEDDE
jgi:hypothetical protein